MWPWKSVRRSIASKLKNAALAQLGERKTEDLKVHGSVSQKRQRSREVASNFCTKWVMKTDKKEEQRRKGEIEQREEGRRCHGHFFGEQIYMRMLGTK